MSKIEFCVALNKEFVIGFRAMMNSVLKHTDNFNLPILCIDIDLDEEDHKKCREIYQNIEFIKPIQDNYKKLPKHAPALKYSFFKLEVFRLAAERKVRLLFVDSDIIFVDSIEPLIKEKSNADMMMCPHKPETLFNTGLMIINEVPIARYNNVIKMMSNMKRAHLGDQDTIIEAVKRRLLTVSPLNRKWNVTKRQALKGRSYIGLHFVGKKPFKGGEKGFEELEKIWQSYSL